jgi:long-chain fatty acid transport protein
MRFRTLLILLLLTAALEPRAFSSAFAINELGARAQGMAGTFTAIADDGSAMFFNPAGLAMQKRTAFEMHNLVVVGLFRFTPSEVPNGQVVPEKGYAGLVRPHFIAVANSYAVLPVSPKMTFGMGIFAPFGLAANFTNFNDGDPALTKFPARFAGTRGRLESIWFQPTVGYQLSPNSSIGLGVALVHTHLFLERSILNPLDDGTEFGKIFAPVVLPGISTGLAGPSIARLLPEGRFRAAATSNAPGFSVGYLHSFPDRKFKIGLSWRSPVVHHLNGEAAFAFNPGGALVPFLPADKALSVLFPNQKIKANFVTPGNYSIGISTTRWRNLLVAADFELQEFSKFKDLPINFSQTKDTATPAESRLVFDFHNSYQIKFGVEKPAAFDKKFLKFNGTVRAGYSFDHTPVPDKSTGPIFPDSSRNNFTVGATQRSGNMDLTLFYQAMFMIHRTTNVAANDFQFTNGLYHNFAHLAGAGITLYLGKPRPSTAP